MNLSEVTIGDIYVDENGRVSRVKSYCTEPTITMHDIISGEDMSAGISSLNIKSFKSIADLSKNELITVTQMLAGSLEGLAILHKDDLSK